jgi:hypothetical protein
MNLWGGAVVVFVFFLVVSARITGIREPSSHSRDDHFPDGDLFHIFIGWDGFGYLPGARHRAVVYITISNAGTTAQDLNQFWWGATPRASSSAS